MSVRRLALDLGTTSGWAFWDGQTLLSGYWDLSVRRDESRDFRLIRFRAKLREFDNVEELYFEAAGMTRFKAAAQVAGQLEGVMFLWAVDRDIPYRSVKPTELKKFATLTGKASKPKMILAAKELTGYAGNEDNEADARLVLAWSIHMFGTLDEIKNWRERRPVLV